MKRHLISAGISFVTGFLLAVGPQLDSLTLESLKMGAGLGLLFVGVRGGIKALYELVLANERKD